MLKSWRKQSYKDSYAKEFDFIRKSDKGEDYAFCSACVCDISIGHGGRCDIAVHAKTAKHELAYKKMKTTSKISSFMCYSSDNQTIRAELLFSNFIIEHNIPLAAADHVSKLLLAMFPNSPEVKKYACGRTKTNYLVKEIAGQFSGKIIDILKNNLFSIATDGSNDITENQMYPLVVTYFDGVSKKIRCNLLSLPVLTVDSTGENIAELINEEFSSHNIPWENCLSLSCDNANVMLGKKRGVIAHLKEKNPHLIAFGCLCHLLNLAAQKGAKTLPISFDEILIDIYYYFHRSVKRNLKYKTFQQMFGSDENKILKHCVTRWLSLGKCISRLLEQWRSLLLYFKEECTEKNKKELFSPKLAAYTIPKVFEKQVSERKNSDNKHKTCTSKSSKKFKSDESLLMNKVWTQNVKKTKTSKDDLSKSVLKREERIFLFLSNNLYHALAYFVKNIISVFDKYNSLLQCEEPRVHKLKDDLTHFYTELLCRFIKIDIINSSQSVFDVLYDHLENQKIDEDLVVGSETKDFLKELSEDELSEFYTHVRNYYCASCNYIIANFPHNADLLHHAEIADVSKKERKTFSSVKYFIEQFPSLLFVKGEETRFAAIDALEAEFLNFQVEKIPEHIQILERSDEQWASLAEEKNPLSKWKYEKLSKLMLGVLTFPHSNAACERIFSVVRKNKTDFRGSLNQKTLEAILIAKSNMTEPCYRQTYDKNFLKQAKSATTVALNKNH